jgi:hypothetical protein
LVRIHVSFVIVVREEEEVAMKTQRGGRGIALPINNLGARRGWVVKYTVTGLGNLDSCNVRRLRHYLKNLEVIPPLKGLRQIWQVPLA